MKAKASQDCSQCALGHSLGETEVLLKLAVVRSANQLMATLQSLLQDTTAVVLQLDTAGGPTSAARQVGALHERFYVLPVQTRALAAALDKLEGLTRVTARPRPRPLRLRSRPRGRQLKRKK